MASMGQPDRLGRVRRAMPDLGIGPVEHEVPLSW